MKVAMVTVNAMIHGLIVGRSGDETVIDDPRVHDRSVGWDGSLGKKKRPQVLEPRWLTAWLLTRPEDQH
jgi:hypothetical protein